MSVDELLGAIRAADAAADDDADLAVATRLRVMRSIETRARGRHQLVGFATTVAILLVGTVSWALATGQVAALWSPPPEPEAAVQPSPPAAPSPPRRQRARPPAMSVDPRPSRPETPAPDAVPPPAPQAPGPAAAVPRAARPAPAPPVEVLYRRAHELHFRGGDPAAALAAWDAYLAAEPDGRFSLEARYNRALLLVRLGRYAEARAALAPFASGEAAPDGYRQREAEQLIQRLARYE